MLQKIAVYHVFEHESKSRISIPEFAGSDGITSSFVNYISHNMFISIRRFSKPETHSKSFPASFVYFKNNFQKKIVNMITQVDKS